MKKFLLYTFLLTCLYSISLKAQTVAFNLPFRDTAFCVGDSLLVKFNITGSYPANNIFTALLSDAGGGWSSPTAIGMVMSNHDDTIRCQIPASKPSGTGYYIRIISSTSSALAQSPFPVHIYRFPVIPKAVSNSPVCEGGELKLTAQYVIAGISCIWVGPNSYTSTIPNTTRSNVPKDGSGDYLLITSIGQCHAVDTAHVIVYPLPTITKLTTNTPLCEDDSMLLTAVDSGGQPVTYQWNGPNGFSDTNQNPILIHITRNMSGVYSLTSKLGMCTKIDTITATINIRPLKPIVTSNTPLWPGQELQLHAFTDSIGTVYTWSGPDTFKSSIAHPTRSHVSLKSAGTYTLLAQLGDCISSGITIVVVRNDDKFLVYPNPTTGSFVLSGTVSATQVVPIQIIDGAGRVVYEDNVMTEPNVLYTVVNLPPSLANGIYKVRLQADGKIRVVSFSLGR